MNSLDSSKKYFITGSAGFIGFYLAQSLLKQGAEVIGLDNLNDYYEVSLKEERSDAGISQKDRMTARDNIIVRKKSVFRCNSLEIMVK